MRLSDVLFGIGKIVAFYPGLKKITGTTSSALLLSQLMYWHEKTTDPSGWIRKTTAELTEECGLSADELRPARERLVGLGILDNIYDRPEHVLCFKVNLDVLNTKWEESEGAETIAKRTEEARKSKELEEKKKAEEEELARAKAAQNKSSKFTGKTMVDGMLEFAQSPGIKKSILKDAIASLIAKRLRINPSGKKYEDFIEYAAVRWLTDKQSTEVFLNWWIENNPNPTYWSAEKMKVMWPRAFQPNHQEKVDRNSIPVVQLEPKQEEDFVPMPRDLSGRHQSDGD